MTEPNMAAIIREIFKMRVVQLLNQKGRNVYTVSPKDSISSVAALLYARKVGALVVSDQHGRVIGMVSERDIVRSLALHGAEALKHTVDDIMTKNVVYAQSHEEVEDLLDRMTDRRIRHLPVMEGSVLLGIVSIGDLVKARIASVEHEAQSLKAYILAG